jgi:hypothetical protein
VRTARQDSTLGEEVSMFGRKADRSRAAAMITIATGRITIRRGRRICA